MHNDSEVCTHSEPPAPSSLAAPLHRVWQLCRVWMLAFSCRSSCCRLTCGITTPMMLVAADAAAALAPHRSGLLCLPPRRQQLRPARQSSLQCSATAAAFAAAASFDSSGGSAAAEGRVEKRGFPAFLAAIRAIFFYTTTLIFATPLFCLMLLAYPYVLKFDKFR